ncbi:hypothetical protein BU25DRAFT_105272 [Macroventuria anomochaeta]|uniref:Uncharacterized protein n=1 Tax=Macroventuria anomochaeta TaxID=301207 RepID=A0ACB6RY67_9PLEO|nr:uncharacterized protein BU25DRAFT_105272 [Macroventuria anomochaeta]KAF2625884.1 hypothetical protein BU25DRAFT_105272 [Macroventuria anomochaeta]
MRRQIFSQISTACGGGNFDDDGQRCLATTSKGYKLCCLLIRMHTDYDTHLRAASQIASVLVLAESIYAPTPEPPCMFPFNTDHGIRKSRLDRRKMPKLIVTTMALSRSSWSYIPHPSTGSPVACNSPCVLLESRSRIEVSSSSKHSGSRSMCIGPPLG